MGARNQSNGGGTFLMGVVTGGAIATGVALLYSSRLEEARERLFSFAAGLRDVASSKVQTVENRVADVLDQAADVADGLAATTQTVRDEVAGAVERGAHVVSQEARKVERFAKASHSEHH